MIISMIHLQLLLCICFTVFIDSDGYEFVIVSLDNKQWHFEAPSVDVSSLILFSFAVILTVPGNMNRF